MPADRQDRQSIMRRTMRPTRSSLTDDQRAIDMVRFFPELSNTVRKVLSRLEDNFAHLDAVSQVDKRTAFFNAITTDPNGSIELLHDMGEALDSLYLFVNDFREPTDPIMVQPFTDANVTYYGANGVSD